MVTPVRLAWLFDVDGTLLLTGGAAREAFARALEDVLGVRDDLSGIPFNGRTEPLILRDILVAHGAALEGRDEARFWNAVFHHMRALLTPGRGRVLAGVVPLLETLAREPAWVRGLLTGNMTEMARIKLDHYGLSHHFAFGGYGEQAADRDALACDVVARVGRAYGVPPERCIVVGDTVHDVACARAAGARVIAVATGGQGREVLGPTGPDLLLDTLQDAAPLLDFARQIDAGG